MNIMMKRVLAFLLFASGAIGGVAFAENGFFKDVSSDHWAYGSISKLTSLNVIRGYEDGTFHPDSGVTRAEVAQMLSNYDLHVQKQLANLKSDEEKSLNAVANIMSSVVIVNGTNSLGTGFFVDPTHVLTAKHVLGDEQTGTITLLSGRKYTGRVVRSSDKDLSLIEVHPTESVKSVTLASIYQVGQTVLAVGNPQGLQYSVSKGIISNADRVLEGDPMHYIQIDASVNEGNSGGPLIDSNGNVVGLVVAKIIDNGVEGIGFAIRLEDIKQFLGK